MLLEWRVFRDKSGGAFLLENGATLTLTADHISKISVVIHQKIIDSGSITEDDALELVLHSGEMTHQ